MWGIKNRMATVGELSSRPSSKEGLSDEQDLPMQGSKGNTQAEALECEVHEVGSRTRSRAH